MVTSKDKSNKLETRISLIKKLASQNEQDNWEFRSMLKASSLSQDTIDSVAHELYDQLKVQINCTQCGYCCKSITPIISEADVKRIAKHFDMTVQNAKKQWFTTHEQLGLVMNSRPCPFLKDKKCSIYSTRPHDCRSYPHLHKKGITKYLTSIFSHTGLCPIVFHFYEGMKKKFLRKLDAKKVTWL